MLHLFAVNKKTLFLFLAKSEQIVQLSVCVTTAYMGIMLLRFSALF